MSSTQLVAATLRLGVELTDAEFRLLINLAEFPHGEHYFLAKFDSICGKTDFSPNMLEKTVYAMRSRQSHPFRVSTLRGIPEDMEHEYIMLEWK